MLEMAFEGKYSIAGEFRSEGLRPLIGQATYPAKD